MFFGYNKKFSQAANKEPIKGCSMLKNPKTQEAVHKGRENYMKRR